MFGWDSADHSAVGADSPPSKELSGERAWLGSYHLVAIYDRALTPEEVTQNLYAGPPRRPSTPLIFPAPPKACDSITQPSQ